VFHGDRRCVSECRFLLIARHNHDAAGATKKRREVFR